MKIALCSQGYERRAFFDEMLMRRAREFKASTGAELRIFHSLGIHIKHYAGESDWSGWGDEEYIVYKSRYTSLLRNKSILEALEWEPDIIITLDDDMILTPQTLPLLAKAHADGYEWAAPLAHRLGYLHNTWLHPAESCNINIPFDDHVKGFYIPQFPQFLVNKLVDAATEVYSMTRALAERISNLSNGNFFFASKYPIESKNPEDPPHDCHGLLANMQRLDQKCFIVDDNVIRYNPHITPISPETWDNLIKIDSETYK